MRYLIILMLLFASFSCSKKSDPAPDNPGETIAGIEYKSGTLISKTPASEAIVSVNEDKQIYTLQKSAFDNQPKVGEVVLIPGHLMRKVKKISSQGDNYVVETEDALVTEVIQNGSLSFDMTPEWGDVNSLMIEGKELLGNQKMMSFDPIEAEISSGGIDHKIIITPTMSNGKISACSFKIEMSKGGSTSFFAEGTATLPSQRTEIIIVDGKLKKFNSNNSGIKLNFKTQMATAGGQSGEHQFKLPKIGLSIPIRFIPGPTGVPIPNPIPMSIDVGMQLVSQMTILDPISSATATSSVSVDANAGFQFEGTKMESSGSMNNGDVHEGTFDSAASFGMPIDLQFGLAFPRVSLNVAGQEVAFVHIGYTTGSKLSWGPLCKRGYSKILIEGGYSLKIFGQTIAEDKKTFLEKEKRAGGDCD